MLKAKLVVVGGDAKSTEVNLKLPTVIGRGKDAGLTVPHALVSRRHTEIFERDGKLFVRDLGSLNGTFVNNTKIEGEQPLEPNQLLTLGNITFRAIYSVSQQVTERDDDTVTFEEMKTVEEPRAEVPTQPANVQVEPTPDEKSSEPSAEQSISQPAGSGGKAKMKPLAPLPQSDQDDLSDISFEDIDLQASGKSPEEVQTPANASEPQPGNSPAIDLDSAIFNLGSDIQPADQVSASALDHLPDEEPMVSFVGKVDLGDEIKQSESIIESVQIDLGDESIPSDDVDDERLASFIDKLP